MSLDNIKGPDMTGAPGLAKAGIPGGAVLSITPAAAERIRFLLDKKQPAPAALMVSVTSKGCSGLSYDLNYLDRLADAPKFADTVTEHGVTVVVDPKATLYIVGSVMDYKESPTHSGFDFTNPNETGRCGCGESFTVT